MNSPDVRSACFWASSDAYPPTSACLVTCGEERGYRYEFRPMTGFKKVDGAVLHEWKRSKLRELRTDSRGTQVSSWVKSLRISEIHFFCVAKQVQLEGLLGGLSRKWASLICGRVGRR
jgi:hypothetical protein